MNELCYISSFIVVWLDIMNIMILVICKLPNKRTNVLTIARILAVCIEKTHIELIIMVAS